MRRPKVSRLYICPERGKPMVEMVCIEAMANIGLRGDRYATGLGTYSGKPNRSDKTKCIRHVSIISQEGIDEANRDASVPFSPEETRRNVVLKRIRPDELMKLIGVVFKIGDVEMRGFEDCTPCTLPGALVKKENFLERFTGRGGIRAEILTSDPIYLGDQLIVVS